MRFRKCDHEVLNAHESVVFHATSRIVDRQFKMSGDREKAMFVKIMRLYEDFCGLTVLNHCIMSNHIHLLVKVPKQSDCVVDDVEFVRRMRVLYKAEATPVIEALEKLRECDADEMAETLKQRYTYRMGNISEFMKSLKQKFSIWYNRCHKRSGTLWEQRYGVTLVGKGWATRVVAKI